MKCLHCKQVGADWLSSNMQVQIPAVINIMAKRESISSGAH